MVGCVESKEQYELNDEENDPTTTYHVILRKTSPTVSLQLLVARRIWSHVHGTLIVV